MQIHFKKSNGNVLFGTLFITGIICIYLGGYLTLVRNEKLMTTRSQTWNMAIPIAEAGIEEAMTHLQSTFTNTPPIRSGNGWNWVNGDLVKGRSLDLINNSETNYTVIHTNGGNPVIEAVGFARPPLESNYISRTIEVSNIVTYYNIPGMLVRETSYMNGTKITLDSFDSSTNAYSTNGKYDVTKRRDKAILGTLSTNGAGDVNLGNGGIWGKIQTANALSGTSMPTTKPNASVGSTAWHDANKIGIETGYLIGDVNLIADSITNAPFISALSPTLGGTNSSFKYVLGVPGSTIFQEYKYNLSPTFSGSMRITGNTRLLVDANVSLGDLQIDAGATLEMYVSGASTDFGGKMVNTDGIASSFKYFGLVGNKSLTASGNAEFTALIYAPDAKFSMNGGGNFYGASTTKSVAFIGNYSFHFDESIKGQTKKGYTIVSWNEK